VYVYIYICALLFRSYIVDFDILNSGNYLLNSLVMMAGHQQRSYRYPNLLVTVKHETEERSVTEIHSNPRTYRSKNNYHSTFYHPTTIYYNSNHRQKQHFNRPLPPPTTQHRSKKHDRLNYHNQKQQQPIRPLMEIEDNQIFVHDNTFKQKEPKQRDQYRYRKVELDWDHAFDLDQVELYTTQYDIDNYSLTSINSSSESSFSSV